MLKSFIRLSAFLSSLLFYSYSAEQMDGYRMPSSDVLQGRINQVSFPDFCETTKIHEILGNRDIFLGTILHSLDEAIVIYVKNKTQNLPLIEASRLAEKLTDQSKIFKSGMIQIIVSSARDSDREGRNPLKAKL